jgi:hypothetical protein
MKMGEADLAWANANQALLGAEFARLRGLFGGDPDGEAAQAPAGAGAMESPSAIDRLARLFALSPFERDVILLCAGVEMDTRLAQLATAAQGEGRRAQVTFGLAIGGALPDPHWSALAPTRPLRRHRLIEVEAGGGLTSAPLRIDERILHFLAGINELDPRLRPFLRTPPAPHAMARAHLEMAARIARAFEGQDLKAPVVHLCGDDPEGQEDAAALAAAAKGWQLHLVQAQDLPASGADLAELATLWEREALLLPGALLIQCADGGFAPAARQLAARLPAPLFVASREALRLERAFARFEIDKPRPADQKELWVKALGPAAARLDGMIDSLSEQFRLSARTISATGTVAARQEGPTAAQDMWRSCRSLARPKLEGLAQRIAPAAAWDDLILPDEQKQLLRLMADQVGHRLKVYETWGLAHKSGRGLGVSALFSGASGTGKTMAAEVLAGELDLDLYRIDLSSVVSKYIGETEKNLKQVFDAAEEGGVVLLFDEADALFGKRSEVKDSHDRYANIEVSYLLQRMEAYQGLAILTTNLKSTLDSAFARRLRFTVNFPFPDAAQREAIWRAAFPAETPTQGLNPRLLAQLNVAGGSIRNIAMNAAFLAAAEDGPVTMARALKAARLEALKIERPLSDAEIRGWA